MPMQTPGALQQQVHRRQVAEHEVEVDIQGLLGHLSGNQQRPLRSLALGAKGSEYLALALGPLVGGETRMEQQQRHLIAKALTQCHVEFLRAVDGIDDQRTTAAAFEQIDGTLGHGVEAFAEADQANRRQRPGAELLAAHAARIGQHQTRVRQLGHLGLCHTPGA